MVIKVATIAEDRKVLVLDSQTLRELGAENADAFEVTRHGDVIELRPASVDRSTEVRNLAELVMGQHDDTFRKLSQ